MSVQAIIDLPVAMLAAPESHLYLWVTNNYLRDGMRVVDTWGFRYVTLITWIKDKVGLGQYFRGKTEHCIVAVRGSLPYRTSDDGKRLQGVTGIFASPRAHSQKPDEIRDMIERVSYEPRVELFARERRDGWDRFGNEVASSVKIEKPTLFDAGVRFSE